MTTPPRLPLRLVLPWGRRPAPAVRPGRTAFWQAWFVTVTVAELVGFCVPLVAGTLTADAGPWLAVPVLLAAGAAEGAALGAGQAVALSWVLPSFPVRRWVAATAGAAVWCYALGLLPSVAAQAWLTWPAAVAIPVGAVLGLALLAAIGTAQWWVLRRHVERAARWIPATALAWLVGLAVFLGIAMPWWQPGQPTMLVLLIGLVAAVAMAASVAAVTGLAMVRLLPARAMDRLGGGPA